MTKQTIKQAVASWVEWSESRRSHYHGWVGGAGYCWVLSDVENGGGGCLWWHPNAGLFGPMAPAVEAFL